MVYCRVCQIHCIKNDRHEELVDHFMQQKMNEKYDDAHFLEYLFLNGDSPEEFNENS